MLLLKRSPGSIGQDTKIIWVDMINPPFIRNHPFTNYNLIVDLHTKFNKALEMEAKKSKFSFIIQPKDHTRKSGNFDNFGNLTFQGKKEFWWDIDLHIQEFYQSRDLN